MKKKLSKILVGLLVVVCIVEGFFLYRAYVVPSSTLQTARKFNRIEQIIDKYYKGSVKKSDLKITHIKDWLQDLVMYTQHIIQRVTLKNWKSQQVEYIME